MGLGGQRHAPAALLPRKTRYPLNRRLGGPQGRSGQVRKFSPQPEFDPRTESLYRLRYPVPHSLNSDCIYSFLSKSARCIKLVLHISVTYSMFSMPGNKTESYKRLDGTATPYGLEVSGIELWRRRDFLWCPFEVRGLPSFLYDVYTVFSAR